MARSAESIFNPIPLRPATPRKELKEWGPGGDFVKEGNKKLDADLPTVVYFLRLKDGDNI